MEEDLYKRNSATKKVFKTLLIVILILGGFLGGSIFGAKNTDLIIKNSVLVTEDDSFNKLFEVKDMLHNKYYQDIDDDILLEGAIKGMVNSVGDPYTIFFNSEEYKDFNNDGSGNYIGIGVMVGIKDNKIVVITPFEESPAFEAGLRAGDIIKKVNGISFDGTEMDKAVSIIRGEEGKSVTLTIERDSVEKDIEVVRRNIVIKNVSEEMLENNIGLVTLKQFTEGTGSEVKEAFESLKKSGSEKYILDLRGNPGGFLNEAIDIASLFIPKGEIVLYTLDKADSRKDYLSKGGDFTDVDLILLVDEGSASASEVLAGALKDYDRAELIGNKTFGKGIVQQAFTVGKDEGLKVTVSSYFSPEGKVIHEKGIEPDIEVEIPEDVELPLTKDTDIQLKKAIEVLLEGKTN
ncbi:MAG: S41 family peptidase [Clostridium sp.]|nr:S41 family peptidase [Clostridium sp.]